MNKLAILESGEMYLETLYRLSLRSNAVRAIDLGEEMGFSKPSVSRAVGILKKDGLMETNEDGFLVLTEAGRARAEKIYERHTVLTKLFVSLGVDEKTAAEDACRIEHYLSDTTFEALKAHAKKYE